MSSVAHRERVLTVATGDNFDVCPLCGIHRMNAGFLKATCGDSYMTPGCFVVERESTDTRSSELPRNSGEVAAVNGPTTLGEKDELHERP